MEVFTKGFSVIIPTREEESTIGDMVKKCRIYCDDVIVIDGHSKDKTREIAQSFGARVVLDNKRGKGDAMKVGVGASNNPIIVFIDADGSHEPSDIPAMVEKIRQGNDLVVASRMLGGSDELHGTLDNVVRATASGLMAVAINWRWKPGITDVLNGFRGIKKEVFEKIDLKQDGFLIEHEMIVNTLKKGFKMAEISSHEYERKGGCSKLPTSQGWKFVFHFLWQMLTK